MIQNFVSEKYYFFGKTFFIHFLCETFELYVRITMLNNNILIQYV